MLQQHIYKHSPRTDNEKTKITKTELAKRMGTSRAGLQRLLNPENTSVTLHTLDRIVQALGKTLSISIH